MWCAVVEDPADTASVEGSRSDASGAIFGEDREYRYRLWRVWDGRLPAVAFVALNPSTADEDENDRTVSTCVRFAREWGYGSVVLGNCFALRATDPAELKRHPDPVGPENDWHLRSIASDADRVVAAWGVHGSHRDRDREVTDLLDVDLFALTTTKDGQPGHPLRKPGGLRPEPWSSRPR
jgi:hypothetical protein